MVKHDIASIQALMWTRYGEYLVNLRGEAYRDQVYAYIEDEDTPRPWAINWIYCVPLVFPRWRCFHKNGFFCLWRIKDKHFN